MMMIKLSSFTSVVSTSGRRLASGSSRTKQQPLQLHYLSSKNCNGRLPLASMHYGSTSSSLFLSDCSTRPNHHPTLLRRHHSLSHWQPPRVTTTSRQLSGTSSSGVGGGGGGDETTATSSEEHHAMYQAQMAELQAEREFLFGFTDDEKEAWSSLASLPQENNNNTNNNSWQQQQQQVQHQAFLQAIEEARLAQEEKEQVERSSSDQNRSTTFSASSSSVSSSPLTHLSDDGTAIHMVDVGSKEVTQRMARAQTKVIFPPAVVKALLSYNNKSSSSSSDMNSAILLQNGEVLGPKGPIFATAKVAGIMAAKKTSELIPLCHPLPLDMVQIDIRFLPVTNNNSNSNNDDGTMTALIECECRVTHKTGVEMEALTGATVAALTIYDMVKAVSHEVEITETRLVQKTGGKRSVGIDTTSTSTSTK